MALNINSEGRSWQMKFMRENLRLEREMVKVSDIAVIVQKEEDSMESYNQEESNIKMVAFMMAPFKMAWRAPKLIDLAISYGQME